MNDLLKQIDQSLEIVRKRTPGEWDIGNEQYA